MLCPCIRQYYSLSMYLMPLKAIQKQYRVVCFSTAFKQKMPKILKVLNRRGRILKIDKIIVKSVKDTHVNIFDLKFSVVCTPLRKVLLDRVHKLMVRFT